MTDNTSTITPTRVSAERIDDLVASLKVTCLRYPGTTTTVAIAVLPGVGHLPGFTVAEGHAYCSDPADFDARLGVQKATTKVLAAARNTLWNLEAYAAWCQTQDEGMNAGLRYSVAPDFAPHQQRVIDEKALVDSRVIELQVDMAAPSFALLSVHEQALHRSQLRIMTELAAVLADRIHAFTK